jgi:ketosteroid isomerase-like protein
MKPEYTPDDYSTVSPYLVVNGASATHDVVDRDEGGSMKSLLMAGLVALASCAPGAPVAPDTQTLVALLTTQADAWDKAIIRKDRAAIEKNMADDFRQIDGYGNVETRQSFVDGLVSDELEIDPYTVEDFDVRLYGDVALLSGRTRMTGRYDGKPFTSHYRYIDIYVRKDGAWKIVSVQITKIPE